jgi:hypothetical protein
MHRLLQKVGVHRFQTDHHRIKSLMKRLVAVCGTLIVVTIACVVSVGWLFARPVQTRIGDGGFPDADENAASGTTGGCRRTKKELKFRARSRVAVRIQRRRLSSNLEPVTTLERQVISNISNWLAMPRRDRCCAVGLTPLARKSFDASLCSTTSRVTKIERAFARP